MNLQEALNNIDNPFDSPAFLEYLEKINRKAAIEKDQLKRFHQKYKDKHIKLSEFIEAVIKKYDSDKYKDRWYNRGFEPPETLKHFLFKYAKEYGRALTPEEDTIHANMFTAEIYYYAGYYFNLMLGQGSAIKITK